MDLQRLFVVVHAQRLEIGLGELPRAGFEPHRHCRAEDGEPLSQRHDLLLVQPEQGSLDESRDVPDMRADLDVAGNCSVQRAEGGLDLDVVSPGTGGGASLQGRQQAARCGAADLRGPSRRARPRRRARPGKDP